MKDVCFWGASRGKGVAGFAGRKGAPGNRLYFIINPGLQGKMESPLVLLCWDDVSQCRRRVAGDEVPKEEKGKE